MLLMLKFFFSCVAQLPEDTVSKTIATTSFYRGERQRDTREGTQPEKILQEYFRGIKYQTAPAGPNFSVSWVGKLKQREEPVSLKVT